MARQEQLRLKLGRPSRFNEAQIKLFVRAVDFVTDDGMTK